MSRVSDSGCVITSRIRLARNIQDMPFPKLMNEAKREEALTLARGLFAEMSWENPWQYIPLHEKNQLETRALLESHLISRELAADKKPRGLILSAQNHGSIMLMEEDHIRIQVIEPGLSLSDALEKAFALDEKVDSVAAFHEQWGYLTACPTNLGTGLRASVMLHLPGLSAAGVLREMTLAAGKMGFAIRGHYGEGSSAQGHLYQVSNQVTLGLTEADILERLQKLVDHMVSQELGVRAEMEKANPAAFENRYWRAYGILTNARVLTGGEAMELLSDLRLGLGILPHINQEKIDAMLTAIQPAHLILKAGAVLNAQARDVERARQVRDMLAN